MATVQRRDPPDLGFYGKRLRVRGIVVRAHHTVDDRALLEVARRIDRLLRGCAAIRANLRAAGAELHVIGRDQVPSDLPMYRHLAGRPFEGPLTIDERGRAYGGLHACCDEDGLLRLPSARHSDHRDIASHELAHVIEAFGLDPGLREAVYERWSSSVAEGRWVGAYAATDAHEFFAELTMWYVGSRGDHGSLARPPADGSDGLKRYDPRSWALLRDLYRGRLVPAPIVWDRLARTRAERSTEGRSRTELVLHNHTAIPLELWWLDYRGEPVSYGLVPAQAIRAVSTWVSHVWQVTLEGREIGRYRVGARPGRVEVTTERRGPPRGRARSSPSAP